MRVDKKQTQVHRKRHGNHQKRTGHFLKVYTPYLPLTILVALSILMTTIPSNRPLLAKTNSSNKAVLAYATDVSISGLLGSTNLERSNNGVAPLVINGKLNTAAQAKANDMMNRDYWAHNTPDGSPPWVFITNSGYSYNRAGENLAYGYATSSSTIEAWMGSQSHRENLLNSNFTEVGFGIVNAANYTGDVSKGDPPGQQTIMVAMYAQPYSAPAASSSSPAQKPSIQQNSLAPIQVKTETPLVETQQGKNEETSKISTGSTAPNTDTPTSSITKESKSVNRLQILTRENYPWIGSMLLIILVSGALLVLTKHGIAFQRLILKGERYVLQHTLFDVTIITLGVFCYLATRSVGMIL